MINPLGGEGVTCLVVTKLDLFTPDHKSAIETLAGSFKFFKPEVPRVVKEWEDWFNPEYALGSYSKL